jgi:hypothetical protein
VCGPGFAAADKIAHVARLGEAALHRIQRRGQRLNERDGRVVRGIDRAELARGIALAVRRGDTPGAQQLIEGGANLFGASALIAEVGEQSRQLELDALRAAQDRPSADEQYPVVDPYDIEQEWADAEPR